MGQTSEPAATDVGSGPGLISPHYVMQGKPLPSLDFGVSRGWTQWVLSCFPAQDRQLEAAGSWPYFLEVSTVQWTSENLSTPLFYPCL